MQLRKKFRCGIIVKDIKTFIQDSIDHTLKCSMTDLSFQDLVSTFLLQDKVMERFPVDKTYRGQFLQCYNAFVEGTKREVHEQLLEELLESGRNGGLKFLGDADESTSFHTYEIGGETASIRLNPHIGNNVGMTLWPGANLLAEFLLQNPDLLKGKRCVELGSGIGLTAVVAARCNPASLVCTDYEDDVLRNLEYNLVTNLSQGDNGALEDAGVSSKYIDWTVTTSNEIADLSPEFVFASDCVSTFLFLFVFFWTFFTASFPHCHVFHSHFP